MVFMFFFESNAELHPVRLYPIQWYLAWQTSHNFQVLGAIGSNGINIIKIERDMARVKWKQKTAKQTKRMCLFYPKRIHEYTSVLEGVEHISAIYSSYVIYVKLYIPDAQFMVYLPTFTPQNYLQFCR